MIRDESVLTRRDWLLLFLGLPNARFETDQIRLMKGMFLLTRAGPPSVRGLYHFAPYAYGPFDKAVYKDLDVLIGEGLVASESERWTNRRIFRLTSSGQARVKELLDIANPKTVARLRKIKERVTSLSFLQLLKEIYREYPEYATQSRIG